jgi:serine/threonine-protein kinase
MSSRPETPQGGADTVLRGTTTSPEPLYGDELGEGAVVGSWVVEATAARGGFGTVYRARHLGSGRPAAIKVLHAVIANLPGVVERFHREAETIRRLRHPNIVELLEIGSLQDARPYLVMEWLEGPTLERAVQSGGALSPERVLAVMEGLCAALATAHAAGVVHRDLKASNVILGPDGEPPVKLVDFGVAKLLDGEGSLTATGFRVGTPSYMSPEQILGQPVSPATDVYALGVLLFLLLTASLPFTADSPIGVEELHVHAMPPRPSELGASSTPGLDDVVLRCLEKEPARRYPDVAELIADLRRAVARPTVRLRRLRTEPARALALHLRTAGDDGGLRGALEAIGLAPIETEDGLLATAALPAGETAAREAAAGLVERAVELLGADAAAGRIAGTLHTGDAVLLFAEGVPQVTGGPVLDVAAWGEPVAAGLAVTAAAAALLGAAPGDPVPGGRPGATWLVPPAGE